VTDEHCVEIIGAPKTAAVPDRLSVILSDRIDPVPIGTPFSYRIVVRNDGANVQKNVTLVVELPGSLDLESVQGPVKTDGLKAPTLRFPPVLSLAPKQLVSYEVRVIARRPGGVVIRASATSDAITQSVVAEEDTDIFEQPGLRGAKNGPSIKE
jgi:hypothetical protein